MSAACTIQCRMLKFYIYVCCFGLTVEPKRVQTPLTPSGSTCELKETRDFEKRRSSEGQGSTEYSRSERYMIKLEDLRRATQLMIKGSVDK